jgi:hypothetical protein
MAKEESGSGSGSESGVASLKMLKRFQMLLPSSLHDDMVSGAFAVLCFGFRWLENRGMFHRVAGTESSRWSQTDVAAAEMLLWYRSSMPIPKRPGRKNWNASLPW